ncbi:glycosyltransferase family A protein [Planococcus sp. APC 4015]|nr:glycosyltransferase family A protein [Planococcus sp. APC 4015]
MQRPLTVSVVIPVKDDDCELARCLGAMSRQTRPADEIIVVDNGSTDSSAAVAAAFGVRVVRCETPGIPAASARGYDSARGDVVLRLDADCIPADTWVEAIADAFAARPDVAVFAGGARFIDGPAPLRSVLALVYLGAYVALLTPTLGHLPLFGSNLGFRRAVWQAVGDRVHRWHDDMHDDLDLAFHMGERHRIRYLRSARMGISMRPFSSGRSFATRIRSGAVTVVAHWPEDFPPVRWARLVMRRTASADDRADAAA